MRELEQVRTQLDKQVRTLERLAYIVESVRDEASPALERRRAAREERRARLQEEAASQCPDTLRVKESASSLEFSFDAGPWFALRRPEARLLLALARAPRGGEDGCGAYVSYIELARALSPKMTRRALVQRIYRLRSALLASSAANPFWIETLAKVGFRLRLRHVVILECDCAAR